MPRYDLSDLEAKEIFAGHRAKLVHSERMTIAYYDIDADAEAPEHAHPHEQIVNMVEGQYELTVDGAPLVLGPGTVVVIPPNTRHSGKALTDCRILDVFCPVREDYRQR